MALSNRKRRGRRTTTRSRLTNHVISWSREWRPDVMLRFATRIVDRRLAVSAARACLQAYGLLDEKAPTCCELNCTRQLLAEVDAWLADRTKQQRLEARVNLSIHHAGGPPWQPWHSAIVNLGLVVEHREDEDAAYAAQSLVRYLVHLVQYGRMASALAPIIRGHVPYPRRGALVGSGKGCYVLDLGCRRELGGQRGPWWIALQREPQFGPRGGLRWNGYMEGPAEEVVHCIPDGELLLKVHERHRLIDKGEISPSVDFWCERDKRERARRRGGEGVYAP